MHSEARASPLREGLIGVVTGGIYGAAHTISGHPLDNLKARMQLDKAFHNMGALATARRLWVTEGVVAFTRGALHPLWGSAVYRSIMISTYELGYTYFESLEPSSPWKVELLGVVRPGVVVSAIGCSACRAVVEAPIEQAKVMQQTGRAIELDPRKLYRGFADQTSRTTVMLLCIFVPYDYVKRKTRLFTDYGLLGQWIVVTSVCAFGYTIGWPLETLKNLSQAGLPRPHATLSERLEYLGGPRHLWRGAAPGIVGGGFRNGMAMLAMNGIANPLATWMGARGRQKS